MWDKIASVLGSGVSEALDSIKKLAIDSWHIDPAKAAELEAKAKELEQAYQIKLVDAQSRLEELDAADRKSAREREVATQDHTPRNMAYTITGVLASCLVYFNAYPPDAEVKPIVENVVMALRDGWLVVIAYYFGSSRGSAAKHDLIEKLVK